MQPKTFRQIGRHLESPQDTIALNPPDREVTGALGKQPMITERTPIVTGFSLGGLKLVSLVRYA